MFAFTTIMLFFVFLIYIAFFSYNVYASDKIEFYFKVTKKSGEIGLGTGDDAIVSFEDQNKRLIFYSDVYFEIEVDGEVLKASENKEKESSYFLDHSFDSSSVRIIRKVGKFKLVFGYGQKVTRISTKEGFELTNTLWLLLFIVVSILWSFS